MLQLLKFLQVLCGNGGEKLLLLAEGLLKKHIASHSLHEPEGAIYFFSHSCVILIASTEVPSLQSKVIYIHINAHSSL